MFKLAELVVDIVGNASPLGRTLAGVRGQLLGVGRAGGALGSGLASGMGVALPMLGLGTAGVAGVGLALGKATRDAMGLEDQMNLLGRIIGATPDELADLEAAFRSMATRADLAGTSVSQLGDIAIMAGRMGIKAGEMAAFTEEIARVSIALDDIPADVAAQQIAQVLGVMGRGVDETKNFAAALDWLSNNAKTTGGEILTVAGYLKGDAATLGMSPQDLLALSTAMKDVGLSSEIAGTNMGKVLAEMASHLDVFAEAAGVSTAEFTAAFDRGPMEALKLFLGALGNGRADYSVLDKVGLEGARIGKVLLPLAQQVDRLDGFLAASNEQWKSMAYYQRDVADAAQKSSAKMAVAWNRIKEPLLSIGQQLLPHVVRGVEWVADRVEGAALVVRNFGDIWELTQLYITQALGNAVNWVDALWKNVQNFAGYVAGNWRELIVDAVNAAGSAFVNLHENIFDLAQAIVAFMKDPTKGFQFEWTPLLDGFEATAGELPELIRPALVDMQDQIDAVTGRMVDREMARLEQKAAEVATVADAAAKRAAGPAAAGRAEGLGARSGLAEFADRLQESLLKDRTAERQLAVQEEQLAVQKTEAADIKELLRAGMIAVAAGPV